MATLNSLASRVANVIGKANDHSVKERAKDAIKAAFATRIRQSVTRNGIDEILVTFVEIPISEQESTLKGFRIFKTTVAVPTPTRIKNDAPFVFVGLDENYPLSHRSHYEVKLATRSKLQGFTAAYNTKNGIVTAYVKVDHKYLTWDIEPSKLLFGSMFENPEQVIGFYLTDNDKQDLELPFPIDMLESIIAEVLQVNFNVQTEITEVKK